jgi:thiosulfate/3-mercaptopyruvate sulfurtransferase
MTEYADPRVLVSTGWVQDHLDDPKVVIVEVNADTRAYEEGHVPGAVEWNWKTDLVDQLRRDIVGPKDLERLLGRSGVDTNTTVVLYGAHDNWFAAWAFWQLEIYGHKNSRIMNGGKKKWIAEGHEITKDEREPKAVAYSSNSLNQDIRAFLPQVKAAAKGRGFALVDARTPEEFTGSTLAAKGMPETCQRGGHIPGAKSIPWSLTCNDDGTFKSAEELARIYAEKGITPDMEVITYCDVGERSSHSWFVLKHLLGYPRVKNYDGSWTEWGNLVGAAIETGDEKQ